MKLLLDTHVVLWSFSTSRRLSAGTRAALADAQNDVFVSVASLWELTVKQRIGKLTADIAWLATAFDPPSKITRLPIETTHLVVLRLLPVLPDHRDPFDHLIIAQAIAEGMTLVTHDPHASRYSVTCMPAL